MSVHHELLSLFVHLDRLAPRHAALAHTPGYHGCMTGHSSSCGEHSFGYCHAVNVIRIGFMPHQNHLFATFGQTNRIIGGKHHLAHRSSRRGGQASGNHRGTGMGIYPSVQKLIQLDRLQSGQSLLPGDRFLLHHVHGNFHRRMSGSFAGASLKHIQLALLYGKLKILNILVVFLQLGGN